MKICNKQDCNNPVFGKGYCKWHQSLREDKQYGSNSRTRINDNTKSGTYDSEKKKKGLKRSSGIKPISDKQAKRLREYRIVRDQFMKDNPTCKGCGGEATDLHHGAGKIGDLLTDTRYMVALCRACHSYYEVHPEEAKEKGISFNRLNK